MKITRVQLTSPIALDLEFTVTAPICILRGRHSELVLDLVRELLGDYGAQNSPDRIDDGRFVIHAGIEIEGKDYNACYIRNADFMGDSRLAVSFEPNSISFSEDDTHEFVDKCNEHNINDSNVLIKTADVMPRDDDRPIFIYEYFDRLDEATNIAPLLDTLCSLNRQVFISVCPDYNTEKLMREKVQIVEF